MPALDEKQTAGPAGVAPLQLVHHDRVPAQVVRNDELFFVCTIPAVSCYGMGFWPTKGRRGGGGGKPRAVKGENGFNMP